MKIKDIIKQLNLDLKQTKNRVADRKKFLTHFKQQLDALEKEGIDGAFCGDFFDFDYLKRETISKVLLTIPGMWNKIYESIYESNGEKDVLHYNQIQD